MMTEENRELLVKDLCSRLPYGVMCHINGDDTNTPRKLSRIEVDELDGVLLDFWTDREDYLSIQVYLSEVKPYLRPLSSMTEVEKHIFDTMTRGYTIHQQTSLFDWLNAHHFDFRGLIPIGLALEVTEENNPYK